MGIDLNPTLEHCPYYGNLAATLRSIYGPFDCGKKQRTQGQRPKSLSVSQFRNANLNGMKLPR